MGATVPITGHRALERVTEVSGSRATTPAARLEHGLEAMVASVLVADDLAYIRTLCSAILRKHGHRVVEASSGSEALQRYDEHRPDAVLLDLRMPEMDGLAALKQIRQLDPAARVAIVTAGSEAEVEEALRAGARAFVLKPFNSMAVLGAVGKLLR